MSLSVSDFKFLQQDYVLAKRMRFTLAHVFGFRVPSCLPEIIRQANEEELRIWLSLQKVVNETHLQNQRLIELAEHGFQEYRLEEVFAEGRDFARDLGVDKLLEGGLKMRHALNPYSLKQLTAQNKAEHYSEALQYAWEDGFKSYFETVCPEAW